MSNNERGETAANVGCSLLVAAFALGLIYLGYGNWKWEQQTGRSLVYDSSAREPRRPGIRAATLRLIDSRLVDGFLDGHELSAGGQQILPGTHVLRASYSETVEGIVGSETLSGQAITATFEAKPGDVCVVWSSASSASSASYRGQQPRGLGMPVGAWGIGLHCGAEKSLVDLLRPPPGLAGVSSHARAALLQIPEFRDVAVLTQIARNPKSDQRCAAARNPNLADRELSELIKDGDGLFRSCVVQNPSFADQALLAEIAKHDKDEHVRIEAIKKVDGQRLLAEIAKGDKNLWVRQGARARLEELARAR